MPGLGPTALLVLGEITTDPILARPGGRPSREEDILVREPGDIPVILARVELLRLDILVRAELPKVGILDQQFPKLDILVTREQVVLPRVQGDTLAIPEPLEVHLVPLVPGVTAMEDTPRSPSQARARDSRGRTPCSPPAICRLGQGLEDSCAR